MLVWLLLEKVREGHATVLGGVTGAVAGLATITPAAGYVDTMSAVLIGALAAAVCHLALRAKVFFKYDDALDVIAVHFVGGVLGIAPGGSLRRQGGEQIGADGLFYGGGLTLLGWQTVALASVIAYSFCMTWLIAVGIQRTIGLRVDPADEGSLDTVQQGMEAYHLSRVLGLGAEPSATTSAARADDHVVPVEATSTDVVLLTVLLELRSTQVGELKQALIAAGASTIIVSEAHVYAGDVEATTVRNDARSTDILERLRVEVVVPRDHLAGAETAFERFSTGQRPGFTQPVEARS